MRFHPPLFHSLATLRPPFPLAVAFTPSAEYRSAPRNVVLAFARVPFYPFARRLIHVSTPRPSILLLPFSLPLPPPPCPPLFLCPLVVWGAFVYPSFMFPRLLRFLLFLRRELRFAPSLAEVQIRDYRGGQLPSTSL